MSRNNVAWNKIEYKRDELDYYMNESMLPKQASIFSYMCKTSSLPNWTILQIKLNVNFLYRLIVR